MDGIIYVTEICVEERGLFKTSDVFKVQYEFMLELRGNRFYAVLRTHKASMLLFLVDVVRFLMGSIGWTFFDLDYGYHEYLVSFLNADIYLAGESVSLAMVKLIQNGAEEIFHKGEKL